MPPFLPPADLVVAETDHWIINHRVDSALPGYFMVGSRSETNSLSDLPEAAVHELGIHLAWLQENLTELFDPPHFYIGRNGHMAGHSIHFHVIPVYDWVADAFVADDRYRVLHQFYTPGDYDEGSDAPFDGAEMTLYIWREFCESSTPPAVVGPSVAEVVASIRTRWSEQVGAG
ncbi:MAG: HIT family protein [Verrucomicrobiales bacterium]|nr:HIT family protein [Verrucomicrobiales bacterium]